MGRPPGHLGSAVREPVPAAEGRAGLGILQALEGTRVTGAVGSAAPGLHSAPHEAPGHQEVVVVCPAIYKG